MASPPRPLRVDVQLEERDLRDLYAHGVSAIRPAVWVGLFALALLGVVLYLAQGATYLAERRGTFLLMLVATAIPLAMLALPWILARREHAVVEKFSAASFTFGEDEVEVSSVRGAYRHAWSDLERTRESRRAFFLFLTRSNAYVLPKRHLAPGEEEALRALLREKVPRR